MDPYIRLTNDTLIFLTNEREYPYLLEVTKFVINSDNPNNYNGERQFRLLDKNFRATGDGYSYNYVKKYFPDCNIV